MSEPKFTPGPWDYRPGEYDDWGWIRGGPGGMTIGHAHSPLDEDDANQHRRAHTDPWEANARLMAAAPELYEALIIVTGALIEHAPEEQRAIQQAQHAIAKAEGRS